MIHKVKTKHFLTTPCKVILFVTLSLLSFSCSKTTNTIGNGLISEGDLIAAYYTDTVEISCHSTTIDSIVTKGMSTLLLGSMMDPVMGSTNANIFTQLHLSSTNQRFGTAPVIDSVILQLAYSGYFGDTTTLQTLHVYELADSLSSTENYYQISDVAVKPTDLANGFQFYPHPKNTGMVVGTDTITQAVVRIPLSNSFGEQLVQTDTSVYASPENFKKHLYGLKICCESVTQDGAILSFLPTSNTITVLQLYYHESPEAENRLRYNYYITADDVYFNQYQHDYTLGAPEFVQQVVDGDTAMGQQQLYLQSMGGVRTLIRFPHLHQWTTDSPNSHLIINEAKLILPNSPLVGDSSLYESISSLALLYLKSDGGTSVLPDYFEGSSYYGGSYSSTNSEVVFRIGEYLQKRIKEQQPDPGMYLSITGASYNALRWILNGPEAEENKLRCEIKYSFVGE